MPNKKKEEKHDFSKDDMRIFAVKPTLPVIKLKREINPILPKPPTSMLFIMSSGGGKSNLISNLVFRPEYYGDIFEKIIFVSPTVERDQSTQPFMREEMEDIVTIRPDPQNMDQIIHDFIETTKNEYDVKDPDKPDPPMSLLILDDISGYLRRTDLVVNLISRNRHFLASLMISNQTLKDLPRQTRTLCKAVFLSRCTSMIEQKVILEEWGGKFAGGEQQMLEIWNEATSEKYNFLYMNWEDETNPRFFQIGKDGLFEFENVASNNPTEAPMGGPDQPDEEEDPLKAEDPLYCNTCGMGFKTPDKLARHEMSKRHQKAAGNFY